MGPRKTHLRTGTRRLINWRYVRLLFKNGKDTKQIAETYDVSEARIYNGLAFGYGTKKPKPNPDFRSPSPRFNIVTRKRSA